MKTEEFKDAINNLSPEYLQDILDGAGLIVVQDKDLKIGRTDSAYVIYELDEDKFESTEELRAFLIENSTPFLKEYYRFNPLSKEYFNIAIADILKEYDGEEFMSYPGKNASLKIFVDDGIILVEGEDSGRFKYGMNLKLEEKMPKVALENKLRNWVQSGSAYSDYISINVCRFSSFEE